MEPLTTALISLAISLLITAIASRMIETDTLKAKGLDDFQFPTAEQDRDIPVGFGDFLAKGPNVIWFGDYRAHADKEGGSAFSKKQIVGYQYAVGMEIAICFGELDELKEIRFGDEIAWSGTQNVDGQEFSVSAMDLFGGNKNGGGVSAYCAFYKGTSTQTADDYMTAQVGEAYRHKGLAKLIWKGASRGLSPDSTKWCGYIGDSNVVQPIQFRVGRYPNYLGSNLETIGTGDQRGANPAEVLFAIITGRYITIASGGDNVLPSIPDNLIDNTSFLAVASTLNTEGMGISFQWQRDSPPTDIVNDIIRHIDGYLFEDNSTGLITLKLNRQDYDPNTVPVFDESNVTDVISYTRLSPDAAVNRMKATFTDPSQNFKSIPVMVEDLGNIYEQDSGSAGEIDLHMFHDADVTVLRASQELVQMSEGIVSGQIQCNRDAYSLNIGDVFKFSWAALGVADLLLRVTEKETGGMNDRTIKVSFVQDVFGIGSAVYSTPNASTWVDIFTDPVDISVYEFMEQPYWMLNKYNSGDSPHALFLLAQYPTGDTSSYAPWLSLNSASYNDSLGEGYTENSFTTLAGNYEVTQGPSYDNTTGILVNGEPFGDASLSATFTQIQDEFRNWALVNGELIAYESVTDIGGGIWKLNGVYRGLLDTSPKSHLTGDVLWYLDSEFEKFDQTFSDDDVVAIKTLTTTGKGTLALASAGAKTHTIDNRYGKPIRPADVKINAEYYPETFSGELTVDWVHRSRLTATLSKWSDVGETLEAGQTTTLKIYDSSDVLIRTESGLTANTYTYTTANEVADAGSIQSKLRIELYSEMGGEVSHDLFNFTAIRASSGGATAMQMPLNVATSSAAGAVNLDLDEFA